jgi:hypothetical protein
MRYGITKLVGGFSGFIELSEEEFEATKTAKNSLLQILFIEEKFDLVLQNYLEYEAELLNSAARNMLFREESNSWIHSERNLISRRIVNLLTTGRLYLDQSIHHVKSVYTGDSEKLDRIRKERSIQYDSRLGYRVLEALRNYVQHRGFPIQAISFPTVRVEREVESRILFTLVPYILVNALEDDGKFKRSVLEELKTKGEKIDIRPLVRQYIAGLGEVHDKTRELLEGDRQAWEEVIRAKIKRFEAAYGSASSTIAVVAESEEGRVIERELVFTDIIERRKAFERRNRLLDSLSLRFVTNEIVVGPET